LFSYNILSSINDSNSLCPWKGCVHVYWTWTWTAKSFIIIFYFVFMIATQTFFPISREQQQSFYLRLPWRRLWQGWVPWLLKGLDLLGDWKASCKSSVRKWETLKINSFFFNNFSLLLFFYLLKLIVKYFKDEMKFVLECIEH
jgi:hypothetical protein